MAPNQYPSSSLHGPSPLKKASLAFSALLLALIVVSVFYGLLSRPIINWLVSGSGPPFLTSTIAPQQRASLPTYLEKADRLFFLTVSYFLLVSASALLLVFRRSGRWLDGLFLGSVSLALLIPAGALAPRLLGDGPEYHLMAQSLYDHASPDLRREDIAAIEEIEKEWDFPVLFRQPLKYYFQGSNGKLYCYHFWSYPLVNLPAKALLHALGSNEAKAFALTNTLLLLGALLITLLYFPGCPGSRRFLTLTLLYSPALWFLAWPHPEVYSFSLATASLVLYRRSRRILAVLMATLASLQNQPLLVWVLYLTVASLVRGKGWRRYAAAGTALVALLPNLFYYSLFGTPSLLAARAASLDNVSLARTAELFFDLNLGMLPYLPFTLLLFLVLLVRDLAKAPRSPFLLAALLLVAMATLSTATDHWNHGTTGPSRYVIWMLPFLFVPLAEVWSKVGARLLTRAAALATASQFIIALAHGGLTARLDHNRHSYLARFFLNHMPSLYNPSPAIFVERTLHTALDDESCPPTPVIYRYRGKCRKALVRAEDMAEVEKACGLRRSSPARGRANKVFYVSY